MIQGGAGVVVLDEGDGAARPEAEHAGRPAPSINEPPVLVAADRLLQNVLRDVRVPVQCLERCGRVALRSLEECCFAPVPVAQSG